MLRTCHKVCLRTFHFYCLYGILCEGLLILQEVQTMRLILIMAVCVAFFTAIFTGGYEDKPGQSRK
ncbi:hypothetical protein CSV79_13990 [Sporosarcina sp. P13]|nr:hypothetical protein CSV79_13990 [Sporosarcina sp. P13]